MSFCRSAVPKLFMLCAWICCPGMAVAHRSMSQVSIECRVRPPAVTKPRSRYAVRVRLLMYIKEPGPRRLGVNVRGSCVASGGGARPCLLRRTQCFRAVHDFCLDLAMS
jgi:hypothetical protein